MASIATATTPALAPVASAAIPLTELRPGAVARLLETRVDAECRAQLRALGLTDACTVRLCKHGEPCIIQVRTTRIGLSKAVASGVFVIPDPDPHPVP
ncbi:MAG: ferrous iron transport protein A [Vicinamibacterales bacterium]